LFTIRPLKSPFPSGAAQAGCLLPSATTGWQNERSPKNPAQGHAGVDIASSQSKDQSSDIGELDFESSYELHVFLCIHFILLFKYNSNEMVVAPLEILGSPWEHTNRPASTGIYLDQSHFT
jgi:hypothetical protein